MLKNFFRTAWRNLLANKTFSLINILGLALGLACSLVILLWLQDELDKDRFHLYDSRLYRVMENQNYSGEISTFESTPGLLAENIVKDIPEIQMASQFLWEEERGIYVDARQRTIRSRRVSQQTNSMLIAYGVAPQSQCNCHRCIG